MNRINYDKFRLALQHSAKGSTWEKHKYILRKDGTYYYPNSYSGGRHLPEGESKNKKEEPEENKTEETKPESIESLEEADIESLAWEVIRGNFGSGVERRERLGEYYQEIQDRVNEIYKETNGTWRVGGTSKPTESQVKIEKAGESAIQEAIQDVGTKPVSSSKIDLSTVYSVYNKQEGSKKSKDRESKGVKR